MIPTKRYITNYFSQISNNPHIGNISVSSIVKQYKTPLFVYNSAVLEQKWESLRRALPQEFSIYYSVKANPNPHIIRYFLSKGCGLEVASGGEFHLALHAGCPPSKIFYAGPGKTEKELEFVLTHNIGEIHIESLVEVDRIAKISSRIGSKARVAVRVNPGEDTQGGAMRMGGKPAPFGIDEERLDTVLNRILSDRLFDFRGIHLFMGTQILDHTILTSQYRKGLDIARRVASRLQGALHTVDFGGGMGIPYFAHEEELDIEKWNEALVVLLDTIRNDALFAKTKFVVEPGRYLVGESGIYITHVNDIKVSRGKKFLILNGGMHHHLAASGNLGQVIKRNFPAMLLNKLQELPDEKVDLVGPLCTPLDVISRDVILPHADIGDLVGVFQSGAYARTASPLQFLSHPTPAEVLIRGDDTHLIRRRGTYDDFLNDIP